MAKLARRKAADEELAKQAELSKAALQKAVADALEKQKDAYEAKMLSEKKERNRLKRLEEEEEARQLARKKAAE